MTTKEQTLESWIYENQGEIEALIAFSIRDVPDEPGAIDNDIAQAARDGSRAGFFLADMDSFVLKAHAAAVQRVRKELDDYTAKEREVMAKADPVYLQVLKYREQLSVVVQALKQRAFIGMNSRRSGQMPAAAHGD